MASVAPMHQLTDRDRSILAFEGQWWKHPGSKEAAIAELFALTPTRYYQLLGRLVDEPAALAHAPVVVTRLRRIRARRGLKTA